MGQKKPVSFVQIIECEMSELYALRGAEFESPAVEIYALVMESFFGGNTGRLERLESRARDLAAQVDDGDLFYGCVLLRKQLLSHEVDLDRMFDLAKRSERSQLWKGECYALLAYACDLSGNDIACRDCNLTAYRALVEIGAKRKSVRILANYLAAEDRIDPSQSRITDLLYLLREARKSKEISTVANTLKHLSREYQILGALDIALSYATKAVAIASKMGGSLIYYEALTQRCHLLAQMNHPNAATLDYQLAVAATFPTIQGALTVLRETFPGIDQKGRSGDDSTRNSTDMRVNLFWQLRRGETPVLSLSKLEQKLLKFLSARARTKEELAEHLYGNKISQGSANSRLFMLISRLRKRLPNMIEFVHGKYRLAETTLLHENKAG